MTRNWKNELHEDDVYRHKPGPRLHEEMLPRLTKPRLGCSEAEFCNYVNIHFAELSIANCPNSSISTCKHCAMKSIAFFDARFLSRILYSPDWIAERIIRSDSP